MARESNRKGRLVVFKKKKKKREMKEPKKEAARGGGSESGPKKKGAVVALRDCLFRFSLLFFLVVPSVAVMSWSGSKDRARRRFFSCSCGRRDEVWTLDRARWAGAQVFFSLGAVAIRPNYLSFLLAFAKRQTTKIVKPIRPQRQRLKNTKGQTNTNPQQPRRRRPKIDIFFSNSNMYRPKHTPFTTTAISSPVYCSYEFT